MSNEPSLWDKDWDKNPIPGDSLRTLFLSLEPTDLRLKNKSIWLKKIEDTVICYEEYVNTVCGDAHHPDGGKRHEEKWNEFRSLLNSWGNQRYNFSLHY